MTLPFSLQLLEKIFHWRTTGGPGRDFIVDENISEGPWHSNSQGLTAWVMDGGEGGEEELLKFRAGMGNKVIRHSLP